MQLKRNKEMEFETLNKNYKKQIVIGALAICVIGGALTFNLTKAKYKVTESIPLVRGNINYNVPDLRVVAIKTSEDGTNYTDVSNVPTSGYALNTTNSICKIATTDTKDNNITIEYKDGKVNFLGVGNKNTRCYLYFDKKIASEDTLAKLNITPKTGTPNFASTATTDEGVYSASDGMYGGTSYYWRGAATTNYLKFANFCWRIVRINGDGSIRLIYDGTTCHANGQSATENLAVTSQAYNPDYNRSEYVGWTYSVGSQRTMGGSASNIKTQTDNWFTSNITGTNTEKVADGKFCNDRDVQSGYSWSSQTNDTFFYAAYERLQSAKTPTLACPSGDVYTMKAGAITADEVAYAGGIYNFSNNSYYLYNGQYYWAMTPYAYSPSALYPTRVFCVLPNGTLNNANVDSTTPSLRPVINLKADTLFAIGGNGTLNNPYVVQ